jgi:regulator of nucleoside diphosphate kinase
MTTRIRRKPPITIAKSESARLLALAAALAERNPELSDTMFGEIERARIVADTAVGGNVVRMGTTVTYQPDGDEPRTVTLVYPGEADIDQGRISIATPVGVALIGLSTGQSIAWTARDGRGHQLTVLAVHSSEAVLP